MSEEKEIRFIRFRNPEEDIVGYVTFKENDSIIVDKPLYVVIETIYEEARQVLSLQEYLPQSVVSIQQIELKQSDILFTSPVSVAFVDEYKIACDYYYVEQKIKLKPSKKKSKSSIEQVDDLDLLNFDEEELEDNVVSIMEALLDKRNKPIH
jgi:hypothetical protein